MSLSLFRYIVAIDQHQQNGAIDISIRDWKCTDCSYCDDEIFKLMNEYFIKRIKK